MLEEYDVNGPILSAESEVDCLKQEIVEKTNYLDRQKNELAIKIKANLRKDMEAEVNKLEKENKIKRFFKKIMNTCT